MSERLQKLIKLVYKKWKADQAPAGGPHPDEETMVGFLEHRLPKEDSERLKLHLVTCDSCAEIIVSQMRLGPDKALEVPRELLARVKGLVGQEEKISVLEICLMLKEKVLEILSTTGDVLVGQELVPAPVLRSRQIKDFKDEVTVLKDFQNIRVEAKIENKLGAAFSLTVIVKEKTTQKIMKDLRVTLIKDDLELESYLNSSGRVTFEHVALGKYTVEISTLEDKLASVLLDIRV